MVGSICVGRRSKKNNVEMTNTRKVHPVLAFVAALLGFGLGYVYIGKARAGVAVILSFYLMVVFFAWTRMLVYSAAMLWLMVTLWALLSLLALLHPIILAVKNRAVPARRYNRWWFYVLWGIGVAAIGPIIFTSRSTILGYEPFRVRSTSMSPALEQDEFFVTDTWAYRHHAVKFGEIVVLERLENPGVKYVKRVVAVAGDSVELRDGVLYRNGVAVDEPYLHAPLPYTGSPRTTTKSILGPGLIYVLGDFRDNSMDSPQWGPFETSSLQGRAQYIWWSFEGSKVQWQRIGTSFVSE